MAVVDANVIIHGRGSLEEDRLLTVPSVKDEIRSSEALMKLEVLDLETVTPGKETVEKVEKAAEELGSEVSTVDMELLALAIDTGEQLLTDDRDLQNLALAMDADFDGFMDEPVSEERSWVLVCENCGREVSRTPCPRCGTDQVRRRRD